MLSQGVLTNPIGLPPYYQHVVLVRVIGSLTFYPGNSFVLVRSEPTDPANVISATAFLNQTGIYSLPIERRRIHSRFEPSQITDIFVYETGSKFCAASSLRGKVG